MASIYSRIHISLVAVLNVTSWHDGHNWRTKIKLRSSAHINRNSAHRYLSFITGIRLLLLHPSLRMSNLVLAIRVSGLGPLSRWDKCFPYRSHPFLRISIRLRLAESKPQNIPWLALKSSLLYLLLVSIFAEETFPKVYSKYFVGTRVD